MNRGVWVAAVALGLSGLFSELTAQETAWRPVKRPGTISRGAPADPSPSRVLMLKPVPILRASSAALEPSPRPFPASYRDSDMLPALAPMGQTAQAIAVVAPPGAVIAASARRPGSPPSLPTAPPEDSAEPAGDQFAADRNELPRSMPGPAPRPFAPDAPPRQQVAQVANWQERFPVMGPEGQLPPAVPGVDPVLEPGVVAAPVTRAYLRAEYLLWWLKNDNAPALVTTGDPNNPFVAGALGNPDTRQLFGGNLVRNPFSGVRLMGGYFIDDCGTKAIEVGGFFLAPRSRDFTASSAQFPVLTRPFFAVNPELNQEFVQRVAFPGAQVGSINIHAPTQLWGLEANLLCQCCCGCDYWLYLLAGPRYLNLREGLTIVESIQSLPGDPIFMGARISVFDSFSTQNQFYGGQVGAFGRWYRGPFSVDATVKVALGVTHQQASVAGNETVANPNGTVQSSLGGLLALNSNIGTRSRDTFGFVPEVGFRLGYAVTDYMRLLVGYNFLYWNSVVRPGDQIDRGLDVTRIPNFPVNFNPLTGQTITPTPVSPPRPAPLFNTTDFWAQGLTFGVEFTF